jgi:hypothetical protein
MQEEIQETQNQIHKVAAPTKKRGMVGSKSHVFGCEKKVSKSC